MTKILLNFERSELGQTLKSSIIYNIEAIHKNCKIIESNFDFLASSIKIQASNNKIILEKIELNQKIAVKIINQAKEYITISEAFSFFVQIYKSKFQNIALQIYHHIKTIVVKPQAVLANQLQSEFISIHITFHHVTIAQKLCPNSCINVTRIFIG